MARRKFVPMSRKNLGTTRGRISKIRKGSPKKAKNAPQVGAKTKSTRKGKNTVKSNKPVNITPKLVKTIQMPFVDGESTSIDAIAVMSKNHMLMATGTQELRSVDVKKNPKILCSYDLDDICRIVKLDSNRAIVYYPYENRSVDIFKVLPKMERIKSLRLEQAYDAVGVTNGNLITAKYVDSYTTAFQILDTDGVLLQNFRPKLLNNIGLRNISSLHVTPTNNVVVVDASTAMVYVMPLDRGRGFAYWGNDQYIPPIPSDVAKPFFQTFCYRLQKPLSLASDEDGNVYVGDRASGLVTKIDPEGNFIQNLLPLDGDGLKAYFIHILYDKGHLYVFDDQAGYGRVFAYKL